MVGLCFLHVFSFLSLCGLKHSIVFVFVCVSVSSRYNNKPPHGKMNTHQKIDVTPTLPHDIFNFEVTLLSKGS